MKLSALDHPKTLDFAARLGVSLPLAIGHLELLWAFTATKTPHGNIGKWADGAIARGAHWQGDPEVFVQALIDAGFLDISKNHRLLVHDWNHHSPNWVKAKLRKAGEPFASDSEVDVSADVRPDVSADASADYARARSPRHAMPRHAKKKAAPTKRERATPHLIPDEWQPNQVNRQWLVDAGMTEAEQHDVIDEFKRWAKNSGHRRANWDLVFIRNPAVKSAVGRRKTHGKASGRDRPKSAVERSREGINRYLDQQEGGAE